MSIGIQFSFRRAGKCILLVYILLDNLLNLLGIYVGFFNSFKYLHVEFCNN